ncbi:MAG: DUF4430 domain-containing protein [Ruminococcus sp.]|nr:DUF4430 domain-containing protein [Ruminococcus sp.]
MKSNTFAKITAWLILPVIVVASIIVVSAIKTSTPHNPMEESLEATDFDEVGAGALGLPESILSSAVDSRSERKTSSDTSENNSDNNSYTKADFDINNPSFPGTSDGTHSFSTSSDSSDVNVKHYPSDSKAASPRSTDTDYFTTSIKDGETVHSRSYSFTITHKHPELKVKDVSVFVDNKKQSQFDGRVLLQDGKNKIRIDITYTDKDAKAFSVYREYTVHVKLDGIKISTDLKDKNVDTSSVSFYVHASIDGENLPVDVRLNGEKLVSTGDSYTAVLQENDNTIVISSSWHDKSISKTYHITYTPVKPLEIRTSLQNCTVDESDYYFSAYTTGGSAKAKLSVTFNGTPLANSKDYNVTLKTGSNTIRLKATDVVNGEKISNTQDYIIRYIPVSDEASAPKIQHININDGMSVKGSDYNLDILPVDFEGNRIYYNGIAVRLNGVALSHQWDGKYTSYSLYLKNGVNRIDIRITDKAGRYTDYIYDINCLAVSDGDEIGTVTISVDANVLGLGNLIAPEQVTIHQGESAADVLLKFLQSHGFVCDYSGNVDNSFYLSRLRKNGVARNVSIPKELADEIDRHGFEWKDQSDENSIGELDYCQGSGWIYSINGSFPNYSLSKATLKDGYELRIRFTLAYGKDVGGGYDLGYEDNFDKIW